MLTLFLIFAVGYLVRKAYEESQQQRMRKIAASADVEERSRVRAALRADLLAASSDERAGWLLLRGAEGCAVAIDGVPVPWSVTDASTSQSNSSATYRDSLGRGPHGFVGIFPGRHVVAASTSMGTVTGVFTLGSGEAYGMELTADGWAPLSASEMELGVARYADLTLLPYGPLAIDAIVSRQESPLVRPMGRAQGHLRTAQQHLAKGRRAQAAEEATAAGNVLFGSVIPSFEPLAALVGFHAFEWLGAGEAALAGEWLQLGLYVLPDNATLLATLGEIQTKTGNPEGGARALGRALERGTELSEALRTRATALLATP